MIAPHELKNKSFNKAVRGYNCSEVDEYIEFLIDKYTEVYRRNSELEKDLRMTKFKYSELHNDEDSIRAVIVKAQKLGENIKKQALDEAQKIIDDAKDKCTDKINEAESKVAESQREIQKIRVLSEEFRNSLYNQYLEHIKMLKGIDFSFPLPSENDIRTEVLSDIDSQSKEAKDKIANPEID